MSIVMPSFYIAREFSWYPCALSLTLFTQPDVIHNNPFFLLFLSPSLASSLARGSPGSDFSKKILDSGPIGYYVLELEGQVATLICLVVFLLAILGKLKIAYGYFSPWRDGAFGYLKL
jgi:hypothetical protein